MGKNFIAMQIYSAINLISMCNRSVSVPMSNCQDAHIPFFGPFVVRLWTPASVYCGRKKHTELVGIIVD